MDRLPIELSIEIWLVAAQFGTPQERRLAVQVALVSKDIYTVVRPSLYRVLQLTVRNARHFLPDTISILRESVLPFVQTVSLRVKGMTMLNSHPVHLATRTVLANWTPTSNNMFIDTSWDYLRYMAENRPDTFRSVHGVGISYCTLQNGVRAIATQYDNARLTHILGYIPERETELYSWAEDIAALQPHLTHIGLMFQCDWDAVRDVQAHIGRLNLAIKVFYARLPGLRYVVVRVNSSERFCRTSEVRRLSCFSLLQDIGRENLTVWFDDSGEKPGDPEADDILCGRDFWAKSKQRDLWTLSKVCETGNVIARPLESA